MLKPVSFRQCLVCPRPRLIDVAQASQGLGKVHRRQGGRRRWHRTMRRNSQAMTLLEQGTGGNKLPKKEAAHTLVVGTQKPGGGIIPGLPDQLRLLGQRQRQPVLGSHQMKSKLAAERRNEIAGSIQLLGEHAGASEGLADLRRSEPR